MKLGTKYHGELEVNKDEIIEFEDGIPGFLDEKKFIILPLTENQTFFVLQSAVTPHLALLLTNPFLTYQNYEFKLDDEEVEAIGATKNHISVYSIVSPREPFLESTINLQAPVVVDLKSRRGKQIILNNTIYEIRMPLFPKVESRGE